MKEEGNGENNCQFINKGISENNKNKINLNKMEILIAN
jgi:hypothetical protein